MSLKTSHGKLWNGAVPNKEIRKDIFTKYIEKYPLAQFDHSFMHKHSFLFVDYGIDDDDDNNNDNDNDYYSNCEGCWSCCMELD